MSDPPNGSGELPSESNTERRILLRAEGP
jgi:hypothetical protein